MAGCSTVARAGRPRTVSRRSCSVDSPQHGRILCLHLLDERNPDLFRDVMALREISTGLVPALRDLFALVAVAVAALLDQAAIAREIDDFGGSVDTDPVEN